MAMAMAARIHPHTPLPSHTHTYIYAGEETIHMKVHMPCARSRHLAFSLCLHVWVWIIEYQFSVCHTLRKNGCDLDVKFI